MNKKSGFTLIELMVVILIVGILAAVSVPLMRGRIEDAKWSEAAASAGTVRVAVRTYAAERGISRAKSELDGASVSANLAKLGFLAGDLTGSYFSATDYTIGVVDAVSGSCTVIVNGSNAGLTGSRTLSLDGSFE
ncbi:MAG: type II secretion system protein [Planctomycetes bacterium]|nr:type II secretion system protein [Planctomycetota bacterium]